MVRNIFLKRFIAHILQRYRNNKWEKDFID